MDEPHLLVQPRGGHEEAAPDTLSFLTVDIKAAMEAEVNLQEKSCVEALHVRDRLERAQAAAEVSPPGPGSKTTPVSSRSPHLLYGLHDQPPALVVLLLALQHCLLALLPCLLVVHCLSPALCLHSEDPARAELLCRLLLATALATLVNNTSAGLGLGLVQGPCVASIAAALLVADPYPDLGLAQDADDAVAEAADCPSPPDQFAMGHENMKAVWQPRARRVQAVLLLSSALTVVMSVAGLPRLIARFQTPITAAVATFLSALPLVGYTVNAAAGNWIGALSGALGVLVCGLALRCLSVPVPVCSVRRGGLHARALPAVSLLCVLTTLLAGWAVCALLTAAGLVSPSNSLVTSEWREDRVHAGEVFAIHWPAPWGWPSLAGVPWEVAASSVVAALVANTAASLTSYYAAGASASVGESSSPSSPSSRRTADPAHPQACRDPGQAPDGQALQRGLLVSGGVAFLAAFWGGLAMVGGGQETPGLVPLTQAGPLTAARLAGLLLLALSFFPALAAGLASIPQPLLAGVGLAVLGAGAGQGE
ncbi:Solute carrier family 23 member 2 [Frankliniella fusca]|uniref:Solute carrier family 23 member 2 n=1 Tax=Frankliniella fusca TaxID=407009 RepID=A0AAE1HHN1_9NEOP|nr:Solute carrier family 23 member 2 [Frankliniella fusca]